jgi:hypothetical protein
MYWLDKAFFVFHTSLILFLLVAWKWRKTRVPHLVAASVVAFSWFILGFSYGLGYCPCTDWHWQVRVHLGDRDLPYSYMKFLFDSLLGSDLDPGLVDAGTLVSFLLILVVSVCLNIRDWYRRRRGEG